MKDPVKELLDSYRVFQNDIEKRVSQFKEIWNSGDESLLFKEAVFCLFTPQSKALNCWKAVEILEKRGLLYTGSHEDVAECIRGLVRFHRTKAKNLLALRSLFLKDGRPCLKPLLEKFPDAKGAREWLVKEVRGYGLKEASHFLRNVGLGLDLAIIDRHILRCMLDVGLIEEIPKNLSKALYMELEDRLKDFSVKVGIPFCHLDLLFWAKVAGFVFK